MYNITIKFLYSKQLFPSFIISGIKKVPEGHLDVLDRIQRSVLSVPFETGSGQTLFKLTLLVSLCEQVDGVCTCLSPCRLSKVS